MVISSQAAQECAEGSTTRVRSPERTVKPHERAATRFCRKCETVKPVSEFHAGRQVACKHCRLEQERLRYLDNPNRSGTPKERYARTRAVSLARKVVYGKLPEVAEREKKRRRERYATDSGFKERTKARRDRYYEANTARFRARDGKRRARQHSATPAWADRSAIIAIYSEAERKTKETGLRYEVDHIVPLQGRSASGLHVEHNLRVVLMTENRRKFNKLADDIV